MRGHGRRAELLHLLIHPIDGGSTAGSRPLPLRTASMNWRRVHEARAAFLPRYPRQRALPRSRFARVVEINRGVIEKFS